MQFTLTRYAIERLLYRLSLSRHRERFVLKGAMLFSLWAPVPYRATGDLDLLGFGNAAPEGVAAALREICAIDAGDDGVIFKPTTIRAEAARPDDEYSGVRLMLDAVIAGARLPVRIDIGFGDVVTPGIQEIDFPSLLDTPKAHLRAYPPETVVAEKFQALVALGAINSRMKDFFDLWVISETFAFHGEVLADAIQATFERRETALPNDTPIALTPAFADDPAKQAQWRGFIRRAAVTLAPGPLSQILRRIGDFAMPPVSALRQQATFAQHWPPSGPWTRR